MIISTIGRKFIDSLDYSAATISTLNCFAIPTAPTPVYNMYCSITIIKILNFRFSDIRITKEPRSIENELEGYEIATEHGNWA